MNRWIKISGLAGMLGASGLAQAFEDTKVLPIGVRNLSIKHVHADLKNKTDGEGRYQSLAKPLAKKMKFKDAIKAETGQKRKEIESFMLVNGYTEEDTLGQFNADLRGIVDVTAPVISYGVTDRLTLAVAVPIYRVKTRVEMGFVPNENAGRIVAQLNDPILNQTAKGQEVAGKLTDAEGELDQKLIDNGYEPLGEWEETGIGDITLAGKYKVYNGSVFKIASTNGFKIPTGRVDDPDILTDIPFGDGTYDFFTQLAFDQKLSGGVFFNQYVKYNYQFESSKTVRLKTDAEPLEVDKEEVDYRLGQSVEGGISVQFEPASGVLLGTGGVYSQKDGDEYIVEAEDVQSELEKETHTKATYWEFRLGYSSVQAFQRKEAAVPYNLVFDYKKHVASIHTPNADVLSMNLALFF